MPPAVFISDPDALCITFAFTPDAVVAATKSAVERAR